MKAYSLLLVVLLSLIAAACTASPPADQDVPSEPNENPTKISISPAPESSTPTSDLPLNPALPIPGVTGMDAAIHKAKEDLAQRTATSASQIKLIESQSVTWADSSLGCPQVGMSYTPATLSGYLILLEANGTVYEYHANLHNTILFCENPSPPVSGSETSLP